MRRLAERISHLVAVRGSEHFCFVICSLNLSPIIVSNCNLNLSSLIGSNDSFKSMTPLARIVDLLAFSLIEHELSVFKRELKSDFGYKSKHT